MEAREWKFKEEFEELPKGLWSDEPDKKQWTDPTTGLPCLIVRNKLGALCGYVGVSKTHPDFGKHYGEVPVDAHGGLTFSDRCDGSERGICHVVDPSEDDEVWWLGFDCAHGSDGVPGMERYGMFFDGPYRTVEYVTEQVAKLARQLAARAAEKRQG